MSELMRENIQVVADEDSSSIFIFHRDRMVAAYSEEENPSNVAAVLQGIYILLTNMMMTAPKVEYFFFNGGEPLSYVFENEDYLNVLRFSDLETLGDLTATEDFLDNG